MAAVNYLQQSFPRYTLDWAWLNDQLILDMAHIQLLRDFHLEWDDHDPCLLLTLFYLIDAVNQGSLCLKMPDARLQEAVKKHQLPEPEAHINDTDLTALILAGQPILRWQDNRLYFVKYHHLQMTLQQDLTELIEQPNVTVFHDNDIKTAVQTVVDTLPYRLESQQIQALLTALLQPVSIISGGPGTGKTTILLSLLRALMRLGVAVDQVALAAPTGRAANRMTESIQTGLAGLQHSDSEPDIELQSLSATTLHRLLGANPNKAQNRYHANNHLPFEWVVIDEVSMVDLGLMNQLIQAVSAETRLLLIGDQFQLPSVQSGAVLADLMPPLGFDALNTQGFLHRLVSLWPTGCGDMAAVPVSTETQLLSDRVTLLNVSKRCQEQIAALSEHVKLGDSEAFIHAVGSHHESDFSNASGVHWFDLNDTHWTSLLMAWYRHQYLVAEINGHTYVSLLKKLLRIKQPASEHMNDVLKDVFERIQAQRILTLTHSSPTGTEQINAMVAGWLKQNLDVDGDSTCFHGAVIMIQRNDSALGLYNGDIGLVLESSPGQFHVYFDQGGQFRSLAVQLMPPHQLAFAMTVHKSQGSEFDQVLLPLTEQLDNPLLTREIIYTGMTRAKQSVGIFGSQDAIRQAIRQKTTRHSGLSFWYNHKK